MHGVRLVGVHGPHVLDEVRRARPRGVQRQQQRRHRLVRHGERVARDGTPGPRPGSRCSRIRGISGWISACSSPCTCTSKPATVSASPSPTTCSRPPRPSSRPATDPFVHTSSAGIGVQRRPQPVGGEVVRVLVGDEDGRGAVEGARLGEDARVDDQPALALAQDDARVAVLDQLHDSSSMTASCTGADDGACRSRNSGPPPLGEGSPAASRNPGRRVCRPSPHDPADHRLRRSPQPRPRPHRRPCGTRSRCTVPRPSSTAPASSPSAGRSPASCPRSTGRWPPATSAPPAPLSPADVRGRAARGPARALAGSEARPDGSQLGIPQRRVELSSARAVASPRAAGGSATRGAPPSWRR